MTAELQHSINPLARAAHNNFAVNTFIVHQFHRHPEGCLLRLKSSSMERALDSQKIQMRKMMLIQEQVFKQQVHELHRLYNLQKKFMQEIEKGLKLEMGEASKSELGTRHQTTESVQSLKARRDENDVSSSNSAENSRAAIKFDLEKESTPSSSVHPLEEQNSLKNVGEEGDVEVELTLSIGHCTRKQRSKQLQDSDQASEIQEVGSSSTKTDHKGDAYGQPNSISGSVYKENTRPHWLLQDLSLNRT